MTRIAIIVLTLISFKAAAAFEPVIRGDKSPGGKFVIKKVKSDDHNDFFFVNSTTDKMLGQILPPEQRGQINVTGIDVSWSPGANEAAVLVRYGTRMDEILLYKIDKSGVFKEVLTDESRLNVINKKNNSAYTENEIGNWVGNELINLSRDDVELSESGESLHFLITYKVTRVSGYKSHNINWLCSDQSSAL